MTRHDRHISLASSYAPVLIDRTDPSPFADDAAAVQNENVNVNTNHEPLKLKYPYPLPVLAILDIAYTFFTVRAVAPQSQPQPQPHLIALCGVRAIVLVFGLGMSRHWRSRGGWVIGGSLLSLGSVVWEGCKGQLLRTSDEERGVETSFLLITALLSIIELLAFLLLLRLSPPPHRQHPFSLRVPPSAVQSPTAFTYSSITAELASPTRPRSRSPSNPFLLYQHAHAHDDNDDNDLDSECESISSISESSIIDLPPPLEPNRLLPPSVSLNTGLSLAALDQSPVFGPLVRRTRSARFTSVRTLGRAGSAGHQINGDGYGTFGVRDDQPAV